MVPSCEGAGACDRRVLAPAFTLANITPSERANASMDGRYAGARTLGVDAQGDHLPAGALKIHLRQSTAGGRRRGNEGRVGRTACGKAHTVRNNAARETVRGAAGEIARARARALRPLNSSSGSRRGPSNGNRTRPCAALQRDTGSGHLTGPGAGNPAGSPSGCGTSMVWAASPPGLPPCHRSWSWFS